MQPEPGMFNLTMVVTVLTPACLSNVNNTNNNIKSKFVSKPFSVLSQYMYIHIYVYIYIYTCVCIYIYGIYMVSSKRVT